MEDRQTDDPVTFEFEIDDELDVAPDALDLLRTVEMDGAGPINTRPMPALDATTRPHAVPREMLDLARPTVDVEAPNFVDFVGTMEADGAITVPETLRSHIRGSVRVRIFFDEN
ncbi:MAG: hypothetical protein R3E66_17805 [bacterium]